MSKAQQLSPSPTCPKGRSKRIKLILEDGRETSGTDENWQTVTNQKAAMAEWLRCSTRIHKVLYSNLSTTSHGMTLNKSLTAKLSRMSHSA